KDLHGRARLRPSRNNQSGRNSLRGSAGASPSRTSLNLKKALAPERKRSHWRREGSSDYPTHSFILCYPDTRFLRLSHGIASVTAGIVDGVVQRRHGAVSAGSALDAADCVGRILDVG